TGSNGAGKSAIGPDYLPENIRNHYAVFDGDLLFVKKQHELFPGVTRSPKEARKLAFQHVLDTFEQLTENALQQNDTFVYEGHLTIVDTSEIQHITLATINSGIIASAVPAVALPHWFTQYMPAIAALIP